MEIENSQSATVYEEFFCKGGHESFKGQRMNDEIEWNKDFIAKFACLTLNWNAAAYMDAVIQSDSAIGL